MHTSAFSLFVWATIRRIKIYIYIYPYHSSKGKNQHIPDEIISTCMMRSRLREIRGRIPDLKDHFFRKSNGGSQSLSGKVPKKPLTDNFTEHLLVNKIIIMSSCGVDTVGLFILCLIVAQSGSHSGSHGSNREPDLLCEAQRGQN